MKLRYSPTSPYVRKVAVVAQETGLDGRIERIMTNVWDPATDVSEDNPLGKVPALTTDDGQVLCESPVICAYLASLSDGTALSPSGAAHWADENLHALADGILDASVAQIIEGRMRPEDKRWDGWLTRQKGKIARTLDRLETLAGGGQVPTDATLGSIALGCALGYLDFRFPADDWRAGHPSLTAWYEGFSQRPSMQATVPRDPA